MSATAITERARELARSLMLDSCTITRSSSEHGPFDPGTGGYDDPTATTIYEGPCRVKAATFRALFVEAGERAEVVTQFLVWVPIEAVGIEPNDIVTITAAASDPDAVGHQLHVADVPRGSLMSSRRLVCKETA